MVHEQEARMEKAACPALTLAAARHRGCASFQEHQNHLIKAKS
jgi:hypothetical protein